MTKIQYNVKLEEQDLGLMRKITNDRGDDVSNFIRIAVKKELAVLGFLTKSQCKALGVNVN